MREYVKQKWLEALRSGEYPEGNNYLLKYGHFSPLGVLCEIARQHAIVAFVGYDRSGAGIYDRTENLLLPPNVRAWAGISSSTGRYVSRRGSVLDDSNRNFLGFQRIADEIERHDIV